MKLFEIPQSINDILASVPDDGEITEEAQKALSDLQCDLETKVQSYCWLIQKYEADLPHIKDRARVIQAKSKSAQSKIDWLKERLKEAMVSLKVRSIDTDWYDVTLNKNSQPTIAVDVDPKDLPKKFQKEVTTIELNKDEILRAWKAREPLPEGVRVVQGEHVRIK